MKKLITLGAVLAAAGTLTTSALAADPEVPFPSAQVGPVFIAAQTVTNDGTLNNYYAPGGSVVFRAYAVYTKTRKVVNLKDVRYFYVVIPGQPNVKLKYNPLAPGASKGLPWSGVWNVPADYAAGAVPYRILIQLKKSRDRGVFNQIPVVTSMLTVASLPPAQPGAGANAGNAGAQSGGPLDVSLYVDTVNGTRPAAAAPRPIGCTQTNVFKRGEQLVLRTWGTELATKNILSTENVKEAHFSIAGVPDTTLNWGAHGTAPNRVWFWTNAWQIPKDFPLGELTVKVAFTLESGKTGSYDYVVNIIPS
jgi:hypothetical protein